MITSLQFYTTLPTKSVSHLNVRIYIRWKLVLLRIVMPIFSLQLFCYQSIVHISLRSQTVRSLFSAHSPLRMFIIPRVSLLSLSVCTVRYHLQRVTTRIIKRSHWGICAFPRLPPPPIFICWSDLVLTCFFVALVLTKLID